MKQRRLFAVVLLVVTVVLLVAVVSGFRLYGDAVAENERESLQATADSTASQLDALLTERIRTVELVGTDPALLAVLGEGGTPDQDTRETLQRFVRATEFQGVSLIDADGRMVAIESAGLTESNRSELIGNDFSNRQYFQRAIRGEIYVSEPVAADTGNFIVTVSVPIEQNGTVVGTFNAALHLDNGSFFKSIAPNDGTETAIRVRSGEQTLYEAGPWENEGLTTASAEKTTTGWTVTVGQTESAVGDQAQTVTLLQIGAVLVVLGTLVGFALWFYRSSLRKIERVLDGFDRLGNREYGTEIDISGTEEWTRIGDRFNAVSAELARHERELTQYKRAIEEATDLICVIDTDEQYLFANPQYRNYHGIEQADVTRKTVTDVVDRDVYEQMSSYLDRALDGAIVKFQSTRTHPSRGERILDVRYFPLEEDGQTTGIVAVLRDVTEREERAQQLRVVDRVLRHNLRNDLTVIGLQAEQIREASSGRIQAAADEILAHADGLLTTSDKSRSITEVLSQEPTVRAVDIVPVVREAVDAVATRHDTEITVQSPEEAYANTTMYFPNAIEELVENGIVHATDAAPAVELEITVEEDWVRVRIIDDGPGIAAMDRDVLETGRTTDDLYHGSGLGLWLVYWIVQRSGGSIIVEDDHSPGTVVEIRLSRVAQQ